MGKFSNIRSNLKELAKPPLPKIGMETGTSASGKLSSIFNGEYYEQEKVTVEDLRKMLDCDSTIQALYNTIIMPLLGSSWTIEPDIEDGVDDPEAVEQSAWVENALRTPPHKGGMSTPFDLVMAQALRATLEGFAGFEKVYAINDEQKLVYKKIAWRDPSTLSMLVDDRGGFNGFKQRAFIGNKWSEPEIPLERAWLYTYGKEFHNLKGRSAFRSAYVNFDKKRRLMYLAEQQAQSDALKLKVVEGPERGGQPELNGVVEIVDTLGFKATVGVPNGYKVSSLNDAGGINLLPLIEFQNGEMARSVLAMFLLLGSSKTGSYALSTDQTDFFIQALMSIRKSLENHITSYLLPDLYVYNFATPKYGTFKFEDITDSTIDLLKQVFIKIVEKDRLPEDVLKGIVQKVADKLEVDVDLDQIKELPKDEPTDPPEDPIDSPPPSDNSTKHKRIDFSLHGWKRELTPAEQKVNFAGLEKKLDSLEADFLTLLKPIYDQLISGALSKARTYIENGEFNKLTEKNLLDENLRNQYVSVIKDSEMAAYTYGKNGASDEIEKNIPATPKETKEFFKNDAQTIANKQFADIVFKIQTEASKAQRKDQLSRTQLSVAEVIAVLTGLFSDYFSDTLGITGTIIVAKAVNIGRKDVYSTYSGDIYAYQYSAILDTRTCATCERLDGKVLDEAAYKNTIYDPPIHPNCRCVWVAILNDELDPPEITGFPDVGSLVEPALSKDVEEVIVELGKKAVDEQVAKLLAEG